MGRTCEGKRYNPPSRPRLVRKGGWLKRLVYSIIGIVLMS